MSVKRWRYSLGRYYYEDDKYGYAYVDKLNARKWRWCGPRNSGTESSLRLAKEAAERDVHRRKK